MSNQNDIERGRWGGPSPWAGQDSRTDAQRNPRLNHGEIRRAGGSFRAEISLPNGDTLVITSDENDDNTATMSILHKGRHLISVPLGRPWRADLIDALQAMG